ncbi:hypothetical protein HAX54_040187 [Datura stramonium]|uniref:Uncharacterized protein n=1 Tax=Datura stramonium TaxID=4076 RepID=A0ABS8VMB5_DATST|nr:hypothetical protein [Datura stramonium]
MIGDGLTNPLPTVEISRKVTGTRPTQGGKESVIQPERAGTTRDDESKSWATLFDENKLSARGMTLGFIALAIHNGEKVGQNCKQGRKQMKAPQGVVKQAVAQEWKIKQVKPSETTCMDHNKDTRVDPQGINAGGVAEGTQTDWQQLEGKMKLKA